MKVSKRDFLKMLTAGGSVAALGATPRDPSAHPEMLPEKWSPDQEKNVLTREETFNKVQERFNYGFTSQFAVFDAIDNILYDRVRFRPGTILPERILFFSTQLGQVCPYTGELKMSAETNMTGAQQLHAPTCWWVQRIHIIVNPDITDADFKVAKEYAWALWLVQKRYAGGPLFMDVQKAKWTDLLKRKAKVTRSSLEFPNMKGLYIPSQMNFYSEMSTKHGRQEVDWNGGRPRLSGTPHLQLQVDGNGLDLAIGFEGIEFRAIC